MILFLLFLGLNASAGDIAGSKDHPVLSRYPGSEIRFYKYDNWGSWELMLADFESNIAEKPKKSKPIEGARTRIAYNVPKGKSLGEVVANYQLALVKGGFKINFKEQGDSITAGIILANYIGFGDTCRGSPSSIDEAFLFSAEKGSVGFQLYATNCAGYGDAKDSSLVMVTVFDYQQVEGDKVKVNAEYFAKQIETEGFTTLHGVSFDHNSDKILPSSNAVFKEVFNLMNLKPKLNLMIVGHTDNVGQIDYNTKLSQKRAEAVTKYLVQTLKISPTRLKGYGVGPLVPRKSNATEPGRAANRRVEMVPF